MIIVYIGIHIWIFYGLCRLREYRDFISVSYPKGLVTEAAFLQWKESEGSKLVSEAAVWENSGGAVISSNLTGHEQKVSCYRVMGQPGAMFGNTLLQGRYFTEGEKNVCLLDEGTVWQLSGSLEAGSFIRMNERPVQVVGILKEDRPICVIPAEKGQEFDAAVIRKKDADMSSKLTISLLEAVLGGTEGQKIDGKLYFVTACILYFTAAAVFVLAGGVYLIHRPAEKGISGKGLWIRRGLIFLCLEAAVFIAVVGIKAAAPGSDYLPAYWSDFDFFVQLFKEKTEQIQSFELHQEFSSWQRMLFSWRQVISAVILLKGFEAFALYKIKMDFCK